ASRQAVESIGIHVVTIEEIAAESFTVSIECGAARTRLGTRHVLRNVVACMEHERGATLDAYISDAKEHRAGGVTKPPRLQGFAAGIIATNDGPEVWGITPFAMSDGRPLRHGGPPEPRPESGHRHRDGAPTGAV